MKISIIAAILILAVIISLNIYLDHKIASEAPGLINRFSEDSGYSIEVTDTGLDPFFNFIVRGLDVKEPSLDGAPVARVREIVIDPSIFSSIFKRRLVVNDVLIKNPEIWASGENIDNARAVLDKLRSGDNEKPSRFVVRNIGLEEALFHISPKTSLSSDRFGVGIVSGELGLTIIDLLGDITYQGKKFFIEGVLDAKPGLTSGSVDIFTKDLIPEKLKQLSDSKDLEARARVNLELSELIRAFGVISLKPEGSFLTSEEAVLSVDYDLNYNSSLKTAVLDKLVLNMKGLLQGELSGNADIKDADFVLDIKGGAQAEDLSRITNIFPALETHEISGSVKLENLALSGSIPNDSLTIKSDIAILNASYLKTDDELLMSGLNCALKLNQRLRPSENLPLETSGKCTAEKFDWPKTGEAKNISSNVTLSTKEGFSGTILSLKDLNGSFMEGNLSGSLGFDISDSGFKMNGLMSGTGLNLKEAPKTIIPFDIEGIGETVTAAFEGGSGEYKADISFIARDVNVGVGEKRKFNISNLRSLEDVELSFKSGYENEHGSERDTIITKGNGLSYEDLTYEEYLIENGRVNELLFTLLVDDYWSLKLASEGQGFIVQGKDITLARFSENLSIENSGRGGFSGHVKGEGGKFKSIEFPALEWDYRYEDGFIELSAVTADIGTIGRFETDDLNLRLGRNGSYPIVSTFKESTLTGLDKKVRTETLSGDLTINAPDSDAQEWDGNLQAQVLKIMEKPISDVKLDVIPTDKGLVLKNITGSFMEGALSGDIDVDTTGTRAKIISDMELNGAVLNQDGMSVRIGRTEFDFEGLLPDSSLPEGTGEIRVGGIVVTKNGSSYVYKAGLSGKTEGETLLIEKGFITDKDSKELSFTGKMIDSLNEARSLRLNLPAIQIPTAISVLGPFVPESLSQARLRGQADLELVFHHLFYPDQTWGGKLRVLRGEYMGMLSGTELIAKEIYGTVTIKEDADSENPMNSYLRDGLKLSKSIYKNFLNSIKEFDAREESDYLKIGSLEYGIIKIENIDCSLEVDSEEINLTRLRSKAFRGGLYVTGTYKFQDPASYNISFLLDEISLKSISDRVSPGSEYITGRVNGLAWITGEGGDLSTIDGPFMFWATNSPKEPRRVGQALLDRLGARERLILGSSRGYDRGQISGYINDGVITFREFSISNSILGFTNLNIQADTRQNSISINHLISVIRELAKRSLTGGPTIEMN